MLVDAPLKCPISLETPPLCPQITPCGHVFAFPSIMAHLINHGGHSLRKAAPCPMCNAPVVARELRLVRAHILLPPKVIASAVGGRHCLRKKLKHFVVSWGRGRQGQDVQSYA